MSTITLLCIALAGVIMLLLLVIKAKVQPFVALLLVSLLVALAAGIPAGEVGKVMIAGMGGVLGSVTIIIGLGAMLGRMIEHTGGAESLANYLSRKLGDKRTIAALTLAAFFLGIPVFFDVGFIILAPIIYGFAKVAKISLFLRQSFTVLPRLPKYHHSNLACLSLGSCSLFTWRYRRIQALSPQRDYSTQTSAG